jgi:hypothetical protein|nr:hypothetical protein [Kofleriaceae bacterium]
MRIAAAVVAASLLATGCFPHNARYRSYSKWAEGGALVAGVLIEGLSNTGADCDTMGMAAQPDSSCHTTAKVLGTAGLILIVGGLLGFVATVSTSEDEDDNKPKVTIEAAQPGSGKATAATTGSVATPARGSATAAGSAATGSGS